MPHDLPDPEVLVPKPCSCGGQAWLIRQEKISQDLFFVRCEKCGKSGGVHYWGPSAVEEWNEKDLNIPPEPW